MSDRERTHSEQCWRWHPGCAVPYVERLQTEVERLRAENREKAGEWGAIPAEDVRVMARERDEVLSDVERLREQLRGARDGADSLRDALRRLDEAHENLWNQNVELTRERDGLREALGRYGQHEEGCGRTLLRSSTIPPAPCSCGYQAALDDAG